MANLEKGERTRVDWKHYECLLTANLEKGERTRVLETLREKISTHFHKVNALVSSLL